MEVTKAITCYFVREEIEKQAPLDINWYGGEKEAYDPPPDLTVAGWADDRRVLQAGTSRQPGPWSTGVTPYLKEPMEAYNNPHIRHLVLCFGTQLGKTETLYNILGYIVDIDPYSTLLVYPREDDAKSISRARLEPMIDACPTLREKKPTRKEQYQILEKHFAGMVLYVVGANSAAALSQKACRNILRDEIDKYPDRVGKDADPLSLSEERAKSFWDLRKIIDVSSPTLEDVGIWKQLGTCDEIYEYEVACPFCGSYQVLEFKNIRFELKGEGQARINRAKNTSVYICMDCEKEIHDGYKPGMLEGGRWIAVRECEYIAESAAYHLSSIYSPFLTWGDITEQFLKAKYKKDEEGDLGALQNFRNGWLALPWKDAVENPKEDKILERRCNLEPLIAPEPAIALTCGIDVQKFGFWFTVWAWKRSMESWLIHYGFLSDWDEVGNLLFNTAFKVDGTDDQYKTIWLAAMDTGGGADEEGWSKTEEIYTWLRNNGRGIAWGIKGMTRNPSGVKVRHSIIDRMPGKEARPIPGGIILWLLDTDQLKDMFFWRLNQGEDGPQPIHLHKDTDMVYINHILAEEKQRNNKGVFEWVQIKRDNHLLDASIYAHAAADVQWQGGVKIIQVNRPQPKQEAPQPRGGSWITGGRTWNR